MLALAENERRGEPVRREWPPEAQVEVYCDAGPGYEAGYYAAIFVGALETDPESCHIRFPGEEDPEERRWGQVREFVPEDAMLARGVWLYKYTAQLKGFAAVLAAQDPENVRPETAIGPAHYRLHRADAATSPMLRRACRSPAPTTSAGCLQRRATWRRRATLRSTP